MRGVFERDLHAVAQIVATLRTVATTTATTSSATTKKLLEDATAAATEDLAEHIEGIVEATTTGGGAAHATGKGGDRVWRDALDPAEQRTLKRFFE